MSQGPILIVGASGRAAAAWMKRRGFEPWVIDRFADADTQRLAVTQRCEPEDYPHSLWKYARQAPPMPWMFTGGLECLGANLDSIGFGRDLIGTNHEHFHELRDPHCFSRIIHELGEQAPRIIGKDDLKPSPPQKRYLWKPGLSGGLGIMEWPQGDVTIGSDGVVQEIVSGQPVSAAFENHRLLGTAIQLTGESWLHAPRFHYAGNIRVDNMRHRDCFARVGHALADRYSLRGAWGLDAIDDGERLWFLECNPRFTASMELYEPNLNRAKAIYYAPRALVFPEHGPWDESLAHADNVWQRGDFADIPMPGTRIEPGQPVLTIFAAEPTSERCLIKLKCVAAELDRVFGVA